MRVQRKDLLNFFSLAAIQGSSAALPLLIFPLALHRVGAGEYATLALAEATSAIMLAVVLYSFDVDGVARVVKSRTRGKRAALSGVFSEILYTRLILAGACLLPVVLLIPFVAGNFLPTLLFWMLVPLAQAVQPNWLFQALENNMPLALVTFTYRAVSVALVYILVDGAADAILVPAIVGGCALVGSILSLISVLALFDVKLVRIRQRKIIALLMHGRQVFLGNASVMLYRDLNVLLLGLAGVRDQSIAAYSMAEKLVKCLQAAARPLNQLYFPKVLRALAGMAAPNRDTMRRILAQTYPQLWALGCLVLVLAVAYLPARNFLSFVRDFPARALIQTNLSILWVSVFFGTANFMLGTAGLNALGERAYFFRVILLVGLCNVGLCLALAPLLEGVAASLCFVLSEAALCAMVVRRYRR